MSEINGETKRWFVLLVQDNHEITTQVAGAETFFSEKEAIAFAKSSARSDDCGGDGAVYHIMRTSHVVTAKRRIAVSVVAK